MRADERFRERLAAAGVDLPPEAGAAALVAVGALVTSLDDLIVLAPVDAEPFVPSRRLPDDAAP